MYRLISFKELNVNLINRKLHLLTLKQLNFLVQTLKVPVFTKVSNVQRLIEVIYTY